MADFSFNPRTHSPDVLDTVSSALGGAADNKFLHDTDRGKAVKLAGEGTHDICAGGDEIVGFVDSVKGITVNDGYSFGGVQRGGTMTAEVGANHGATPMAVDDLVVADVQDAAGVKPTGEAAKVKTGAPTKYRWVCISVKGDGLAGSKVILERI